MDLNALTDFNLVVTHGGFGRASRASGRPKASLSRHVLMLEQQLGVRLLERGGGALVVTEEGGALFANTADKLRALEEAGEAVSISGQRPAGTLRISAPSLFAYQSLGALAAAYIAAYPDVTIEVVAEDRFADPINDGYDIVIRANPAPNSELAGRCFSHDHLLVVAPPLQGFVRTAPGGPPQSLPAAVLLATPADELWTVAGDDGQRAFQPQAVARFSSIAMVRDAALAGAGIALLPAAMVQADIAAGRLQDWGPVTGRTVEVWALFASRRLLSPKIKAFVELLVSSSGDRGG